MERWGPEEIDLVKRIALELLEGQGETGAAEFLRNTLLQIDDYQGPEENVKEAVASFFIPPRELPAAEAKFSSVGTDVAKALDKAVNSLRAGGHLPGRPWGIAGRPNLYLLRVDTPPTPTSEVVVSPASADFNPVIEDDGATMWKAGSFRLFLSHAAEGKSKAAAIKSYIETYGVSAFVAHEDIEPVAEWVNVIEDALASCHAMAALLTPDFHASKWTDQEVGFARSRRLVVVPVMLGLAPYGFIERYQGMKGIGFAENEIALQLCTILASHPQTGVHLADGLVIAFAKSASFASAKERMTLLECLPSLTEEQLERIRLAVDENNQVEYAGGVPERIERLRARHLEA